MSSGEPGSVVARWRRVWMVVAITLVLGGAALTWSLVARAPQVANGAIVTRTTLSGKLVSVHRPLPGLFVTAYAGGAARPRVLGHGKSRADGTFTIVYNRALATNQVVYLLAGDGRLVRLASVLGTSPPPARVVLNERTTVAAGFALAQFVAGTRISGRSPGLQNAAAMVQDLVDVGSGGLSRVLSTAPNGSTTSTMREFNSLSNMAVGCARSSRACARLFTLAKPPGGTRPAGALDAFADIARNPSHDVGRLFKLSRLAAASYAPALRRSRRPDGWTVALRFVGDGKTMNGPGNMAIDAKGNVWATDNYEYSRNPLEQVCGGKYLLAFSPTGQYLPGSPFIGGGLDGAGFGITLDPRGHVWVGNFGFAAKHCSNQPNNNSVSEFTTSGTPLSPSATSTSGGGFTQGGVSWPQGTVSDQLGNIWIANCGNNSVTRYTDGDPGRASNFPLAIEKPFDIAFNGRGQAFVTGDGSDAVEMLNQDGTSALGAPIRGGGLNKPMGIGADIEGNMWVADSGFASVPCPQGAPPPRGHTGAVTMITSKGTNPTEFTGGGLSNPWGVAVDGHDNVWVTNFGGQRLSEFCGKRTRNCPPGTHTGDPISPDTGYGFDGLVRNTGVQIDPSGNVWVANNWKTYPFPERNAGGYQMVVFIGLAGPLRTPLIGPPRPG